MANYCKRVERKDDKILYVVFQWESIELKFRFAGAKGEFSRVHLFGATDRDALRIPSGPYGAIIRQTYGIFALKAKKAAPRSGSDTKVAANPNQGELNLGL